MLNNTEDFDSMYHQIINEILKYIDYIKTKDKTISLIDIIMEFSRKNDLDIELVGDAIASDTYFKSFIEKDCELHRIILIDKETQEIDEW